MEIRKVTNDEVKKYPKLEEVSDTKIKESLPKKWKKVWAFVLGYMFVRGNNVNATDMQLDGDIQYIQPTEIETGYIAAGAAPAPGTYIIEKTFKEYAEEIGIVSMILVVLSCLWVSFVNKRKSKKIWKVLSWSACIISIIMIIISIYMLM